LANLLSHGLHLLLDLQVCCGVKYSLQSQTESQDHPCWSASHQFITSHLVSLSQTYG